ARGEVPTLARLIHQGVSGKLRSTIPPLSPIAWSTFATGKNAGKHGIFSFTETRPGSYQVQLVNARSRKAETLWSLLSSAGKRVCVTNVPVTYPPERVNGVMISGMDAPGPESDFIHPPGLREEITKWVGEYTIEYPLLGAVNPKRSPGVLEALYRVVDQRTAATKYVMRQYRWDLVTVVYMMLDRLQHFFWHTMEPAHYRYDEPGAASLREVIQDGYRKMDSVVGDLLTEVDESKTSVIVMSDHGAGPFDDSLPELNLNDWLNREGLLSLRGTDSLGYRAIWRTRSVLRATLPARLKTRLKEHLPGLKDRLQAYLYFSVMDWSRTKAFATYDEFLPRGIRFNVRGREPMGIVDPRVEYEELRDALVQKLERLRHPFTDRKVLSGVYRREELYHGPQLHKAPDLIVHWNNDAYFSGSKPARRTHQRFKLSHLQRSGEHRDEGILIAKGPHFRIGHRLNGAEITDLAPTVLHLMGMPVPGDMDGRVLTSMFTQSFLDQHPVTYDRSGTDRDAGSDQAPYTEKEAQAVRKRLEDLGYLS
ncbi:MAG: hypothetical protein GTO63_04390, partial [Anaerolineae bacterium]|nr:hypothetical protein [Anaerolineae bacterium]NIN94250.1 hypothetical protein [Anaerolineae bacterium]